MAEAELNERWPLPPAKPPFASTLWKKLRAMHSGALLPRPCSVRYPLALGAQGVLEFTRRHLEARRACEHAHVGVYEGRRQVLRADREREGEGGKGEGVGAFG